MLYYFKGNPEHGKELINLLESMGGRNPLDIGGCDSNSYYFICKNGYISAVSDKVGKALLSNVMEELTLDYVCPRETEWTPKFKIGDIVKYKIATPVTVRECFGKILDINKHYKAYQIDNCTYHIREDYIISKWEPKRGELVLVADAGGKWHEGIFSYFDTDAWLYYVQGGLGYNCCEPFDEDKLGLDNPNR